MKNPSEIRKLISQCGHTEYFLMNLCFLKNMFTRDNERYIYKSQKDKEKKVFRKAKSRRMGNLRNMRD